MFICNEIQGHSQIIHTPPRSRTKTEDLLINLRFNDFKVFTVEVEFLFRPFE